MGFGTKSQTLAPVSVAQLLVSPLTCPVARFFCRRTEGLYEGSGLAGRMLFLRDPASWVHLETALAFPACHGPERVFISSIAAALLLETKQILITIEGADTPCVATSETRPINLKLPPLPVPTAPLMTMLQK